MNDNKNFNQNYIQTEEDKREEEEWEQYSDDYDDEEGHPNNEKTYPKKAGENGQYPLNKPVTANPYRPSSGYQKNFHKHQKRYDYYDNRQPHKKNKKFHDDNSNFPTMPNTNKKYINDFVNKNSNYAKKPNDKRNYNNSYKDTNYQSSYHFNTKKNEDIPEKPIFINSKLENNGNPEGNFVALDKTANYNLVRIGEVTKNATEEESNLKPEEIDYQIEQREYNDFNSHYNNSGAKNYYGKGYNKNYYGNNNYYGNSSKSYRNNNRPKHQLYQPDRSSKYKKDYGGNKFDMYNNRK